ncbi:hypothetical protein BGZ83_006329 [Gryganskiella cystojenkinii]|nr:hypothetical protein BGZ83_006329 [Gryganskiella cystojenkinii]
MTSQYLGSEELLSLISVSDFEGFKPVSTDSYSDSAVYETIKNLNVMGQRRSEDTLQQVLGVSDTASLDAVSKDSYSDTAILETIKKVRGVEQLFFAALQTTIVGYGNKSFGEFKLSNQTLDVRSIYKAYNVQDDLALTTKLQPGDLTPRRLQTFYRANINKYLENNPAVEPYLWKKYSTHDVKYRSVTFPGAESLIDNTQEAEYLLETYKVLDERLSTNIHERVKRVLVARKVLS